MPCIPKLGKQAKQQNTVSKRPAYPNLEGKQRSKYTSHGLTNKNRHPSFMPSLPRVLSKTHFRRKNWKLFLVPFKENMPFQGIHQLWVPLCSYFVPVLNPMGEHENYSWEFNVRCQKKQSKNYVQNPHMYVCSFSCRSKTERNRRGERKGKKGEEKAKNSTAISIETKLTMFPNKRGWVFNKTLLLGDNAAFMVRFLSTAISNSCSMMSF